jgi:hypothetical protein
MKFESLPCQKNWHQNHQKPSVSVGGKVIISL